MDVLASEMRSGSEPIYPGSHELRLITLVQPKAGSLQGRLLVVGLLEESSAKIPPQESALSPGQTLDLLSEVAASISDQVKQSKAALATLGHHVR